MLRVLGRGQVYGGLTSKDLSLALYGLQCPSSPAVDNILDLIARQAPSDPPATEAALLGLALFGFHRRSEPHPPVFSAIVPLLHSVDSLPPRELSMGLYGMRRQTHAKAAARALVAALTPLVEGAAGADVPLSKAMALHGIRSMEHNRTTHSLVEAVLRFAGRGVRLTHKVV
eukprot:Hpha_TRINITY_DN7465_c0_g1::TRINITY_DN7465_c0_g1_i1::g.95830::m.95830